MEHIDNQLIGILILSRYLKYYFTIPAQKPIYQLLIKIRILFHFCKMEQNPSRQNMVFIDLYSPFFGFSSTFSVARKFGMSYSAYLIKNLIYNYL